MDCAHYLKLLSFSLLLGFTPLAWGAQNELDRCLEQGKTEFSDQHYVLAKTTFLRCLAIDKKNEEALLSLGGVCLTQDELDEAKKYFLSALRNMKRNSPYLSYTYSMLGDIALKQKQEKAALFYYNRSLVYNKAYTNSLVGKGIIIENQGNKKEAAEIYKTALAVEPLNIIARQHLIALEPVYFSDEEILEALKQRNAVESDKEKLTEDDRALFLKLHLAEQRGAIEYLKGKYAKVPAKYMETLFQGTSFAREVLTPDGYDALQQRLGEDAIVLFQRAGIPMKDIFDLRDLQGEKIFKRDNTLTESGLAAYQEALKGKRMFLLPSEAVPLTQEQVTQIENRIKALKQKGYTEISAQELEMVKKITNCNEDTLRASLGLYVMPVSDQEIKYFVVSGEAADAHKGLTWYYVARSRAQKNPSVKVPSNSFAQSYESINLSVCSAVDGELIE